MPDEVEKLCTFNLYIKGDIPGLQNGGYLKFDFNHVIRKIPNHSGLRAGRKPLLSELHYSGGWLVVGNGYDAIYAT